MNIPIISFFTGAGFLDLGFEQAKFEVVWRNEFNKSFIDGYQYGMSKYRGANIDDFPVCSDSITSITAYDIRKSAFSGKLWPSTFGVIGGPPCPDFSIAGKNKGGQGENGKLTGIFFDQVKGLLPTFFIFENVKGILSTEKHRSYLTEQLYKLSESYCFDIKILNSLDVGVPQDRERVIIVGIHKSHLADILDASECTEIIERNKHLLINNLNKKMFSKHEWFSWPYSKKFNRAKACFSWPTTNPFGEGIEKPSGLPIELCVQNYLQGLDNLENQDDFFQPKSTKFNEVLEGDVSRKSFKRLHRWRYSPTVAYGNNEVHLHPYLPRRLSVREAMKIQTVPDGYGLPPKMTLSSKFKTVGNGVPVKLAHLLARQVGKVFESKNSIKI